MSVSGLESKFRTKFDRQPTWRVNAPSRINLIGEHIDYCGGHVLPMAIKGGTTIVSVENDSELINVYTERFSERVSLEIRRDHSPGFYGDWRDYVAGVVSLLSLSGSPIPGQDLYITQSAGTAGLSTSASFCLALTKSLSPDLSEVELARICQQVEHEFAGVQCGIMDQMSIALGGVIYLDCQALRWQVASSDLDDVVVVVMDTGKERNLAGSAYNERVSELHQVAHSLGAENIDNLVSAPETDFLPPHLAKRFRHVATENQRVAQAFDAIQARNWSALGRLMIESHESLRDDYEVSCRELDCMVELALQQTGVLGARMTGGGFGGCAIALSNKSSVGDWMSDVAAAYQQETGIVPNLFVAEPASGLSRQSI